jgi:DNA-binding PadR family transcriptional regulator
MVAGQGPVCLCVCRQYDYRCDNVSDMPRRPDPVTFLPLKTDVALILMALEGRPLHGYAIIKDVRERSEGATELQTGALYRHLRRLLEDALIVEVERPADEDSDDERRRYYKATPLGRDVLEADLARMTRLVQAARAPHTARTRA